MTQYTLLKLYRPVIMKLSREDIQKAIILYLFSNMNPDVLSQCIEGIEREAIDIDLIG